MRFAALVFVLGPILNLIFAFLCCYVGFRIGYVDMGGTAEKVPAIVGQVVAGSPAQQAGIQKGDEILTIDGKTIAHWPQLQEVISTSVSNPIVITVKRPQGIVVVNINAQLQTQKDIFGRSKNVRRMGVGASQISKSNELVIKCYDPIRAF